MPNPRIPDYTTRGILDPLGANYIPRDLFPQTAEELREFERTGCDTLRSTPPTPDWKTPDQVFARSVRHDKILVNMPDGVNCSVWTFEDDLAATPPGQAWPAGLSWPAKPLRFQAGKVIHSFLKSRHQSHSIHHHGLEPEPINDGVGHVTMEAGQTYTYQFSIKPEAAGTYFYHCHRNTVLHFQMGMFGFLPVDPPEGWGTLYSGGPRYDVEALWAVGEIDANWRTITSGSPDGTPTNMWGMECNAGKSYWGFIDPNDSSDTPYNPGLSLYAPSYFFISGQPGAPINGDARNLEPWRGARHLLRNESNQIVDEQDVSSRGRIHARPGQTILLRLLCAGYCTQTYAFGLDAQVVAMDGRPLGTGTNPDLHVYTKYTQPLTQPANSPFTLTTGRRWDLIFKPTRSGNYPVSIEYRSPYDHRLMATMHTSIRVGSRTPTSLLLGA